VVGLQSKSIHQLIQGALSMKFASVLLLLAVFSVNAQDTQESQSAFTSGLHYTELSPAYETGNDEQVVVYEFFGYMCPHCANFQTYMKPWHDKLPENVTLVRVPVVFQPGWDVYAKAYYTAESMGILEQTHQAMFDALHKERKRFSTLEQVADWYAENFNVDKEAFLSTAKSFMIDSKVRQSTNMFQRMQVTSTPTLVINGKYKPNVKALGSYNALFELATFLADKEVAELSLNTQ